ncbi:hypothetical protein [Treponema sp.]|uniref:hypothetical protein n=1 Tax=Treponema sp. TaxID=166 RepID=UPI0025CC36EA|nr:hypothetical protein [Treponema sp.]MBR4322426.1 hypothetical protein [Treponema sp.]
MHKFDYSFLNNGMLPSGLVNVTASISSLKTASQFRKNDFQKVFTELEKIAKIQSVKSSNEIEGIVTTDERIVQIVQQNSAPLNHNEEEISGYRDALNIIHTGHQNIQFNENTVLSLHRTMLSSMDYNYGGQYKTDDKVILEIDSQGNKKVRFAPISKAEICKLLPDISPTTVEAVLGKMVKSGIITTIGNGRAT